MRNQIGIEFWKLFHSASFWIAISIGTVIALLDTFQNFLRVTQAGFSTEAIHRGYAGINLFIRWICVNLSTIGYVWFFFLFPLLAAFAYGWSYAAEKKYGYLKNVLSRTTKGIYYISKFVVTFLAGGIAISIPLLFNLLSNALFCPAITPSILTMAAPIAQGSFLSMLYYSHPWIYSFCAIITDFLWGGVIACISLSSGFWVKRVITSVILPFIAFVSVDFLLSLFGAGKLGRYYSFSPLELLHATALNRNPAWLVFGMIGILFLMTVLITHYRGKQDEIF